MEYAFKRQIDMPFEEAEEKVRAALAEQGFGILTEIDVKATMKKKLDRDMAPYKILGACNPPLAWDGLHAEKDLGVLLPCNVCLYEGEDGGTVVSAMEPKAALSLIHNPEVARIADDASDRLHAAVDAVATAPSVA